MIRDFNVAPRPDAIAYGDGQQWHLGGDVTVTAIHTPGHTAGHCALLIDPDGVAFIGDIDLTGFGPYYGDPLSSLTDFRRTIERVRDIDACFWVTSHHRGIYDSRAVFLDGLAKFASVMDERNDTILQWLSEKPMSLSEMVAKRLLYPLKYTAPWVNSIERRTIEQHLEELQKNGFVQAFDGVYHLS